MIMMVGPFEKTVAIKGARLSAKQVKPFMAETTLARPKIQQRLLLTSTLHEAEWRKR